MMIAFNEDMEKEILFPVEVTNVPKNVVITSNMNDTIRVLLRDKGYTLANYYYSDKCKIVINFQHFARHNGMFTISNTELARLVKQQLSPSTHIVGMKPDKLEIFFNHGNHKVVPIKFQGHLSPSASYVITETRLRPKRATVYAADGLLDSIKAVYIEPLTMADIKDSVRLVANIQSIRGAKIVPHRVSVDIRADLLTEKTIEVPVHIINLPENKPLRLFPSTVKVKFVIATSRYMKTDASDFIVVADYNDVVATETDKVRVRVQRKPSYALQVQTDVDEVSFLIEEK